MNIFKQVLVLSVIILFSTNLLHAQEIEAIVSLDMEKLSAEQVQRIESFKGAIEEYINSQNFSGKAWEGPKIPVNISIQIEGIANRPVFTASLFITSKRSILGEEDLTSTAMKFIDKNWGFEYSQGAALSYDPRRFDALTTLLDFYMLIIIGLDNDTYAELGGDDCYRKATDVFNIGSMSASTESGWTSYNQQEYSRYTFIHDLTNPRLYEFRKLMFEYYIDGIDMLGENKEQAIENLAKTINKMADAKEKYIEPSNLMENFFYTKSQEMAEILNGYKKNPKVFRDLMYLDPSNTQLYETARDGKLRR